MTHEGTNESAAKLDRLEAEVEIRNVIHRYCHGIDHRDLETFLGVWHDDAVWDTGPMLGSFVGKAAIADALTDVMWPAFAVSHHWTMNTVVEVDGDRARHHVVPLPGVDLNDANPVS